MFTPKNIQGALEELYDLCDPDYMVDMLVNYSEEFDDISPALLAKSFQKNAEMISEYRVLSSAGEGIDYQGKVLLNSRAVRLLSYVEDMSGDEKVRTIQSKELWLAGKELNRALRDDDGDIYDIIAGDFLVVGLGEDDFCSLSPELMKQFEEHFHQPETFVRMGRSIMALPLPDDMVKKEDAPVKADSVPHKSNPDRDVL